MSNSGQSIVRHANVEVGIELGGYFLGKELAHGLTGNTPQYFTEQKPLSDRMIGDPGARLPPRGLSC